jgi:2-methylfumaryl-CoA isomerase
MFSKVEQAGIGTILSPAIPLNFGSGRDSAKPAPILGAHTESVLCDVLGLSSAEYGRFHDAGIVAGPL